MWEGLVMIYLDNAATSFPKPDSVYQAMDEFMRRVGANPGRSGHRLALEAGRAIYKTRKYISKLFHIDNPMQVIFTYNATDSLNLALKGILRSGDHVITTSMEHNSMIRPIKSLEMIGVESTIIQCDEKGILDITLLKKAIRKNTKLIAITHASNVTGTLMPILEIGQLARRNNILFLVDASQTAGVYDIDVQKMKIDLLAAPGHKSLMGPQGTGILYIREGIELIPMKEGGTGSQSELLTQPEIVPDRYESGTLNGPGIVGLGAGISFLLQEGLDKIRIYKEALTRYMLDELKKIKEIQLYGPQDPYEQAAVISVNIGKKDSSEVGYILDHVFDIAVRSGLHCAPLAHKTIETFEQGTVRLSLSYFNTEEDVLKTIEALRQICQHL
jgi:cysteine desulfurase/selenocysteine lyase